MKKQKSFHFVLYRTVAMAMMAALSIVLGKYLAINLGSVLRLSFENLPIILAAILMGPISGGIVGVVADLVGCVLVGYEINPWITVAAFLIGFLSGLCFMLLKKLGLKRPICLVIAAVAAHLVGSVVIKTIGLSRFYAMNLYLLMLYRLFNYVIIAIGECIILYLLIKNPAIERIKRSLYPRSKPQRDAETASVSDTYTETVSEDTKAQDEP